MGPESIITPWLSPDKDLLDRKKYADFLTNFLVTQQASSFVLNLNACWGMGKTYFLTNWCKSISVTHPTVYINAWENDFSDDPMLAMMAAISEQLIEHIPNKVQARKDFKKKIIKGGRFLRDLAPIVAKGVVKKHLGVNEDDFTEIITENAIADAAEKSMELLIESQSETVKSMAEFKESLKEIVDEVTQKKLKKPLFIFIDELDRCRPLYAIELLEIAKHLFAVEGVIFIIATDSEQLQHSIRAIYGTGFHGEEYLRRFFDIEYALPEPNYDIYCKFLSDDFQNSEKLDYSSFRPWCLNGEKFNRPRDWSKKDSFAIFLSLYSEYFSLNPRSLNQVIVRLNAILSNSQAKWDGPFLLFLLVAHASNKTLVSEFRKWCKEGNQVKDEDRIWQESLVRRGKSVRWFNRADEEGEVVDAFYDVHDISRMYGLAINKVITKNRDEVLKLTNTKGNTLSNYTTRAMAYHSVTKNPEYPNYFLYFDHIIMAGALS